MKLTRFPVQLQYSIMALVLMNVCHSRALAQEKQMQTAPAQHHDMTQDQANANTLLQMVRDATDQFQDVRVAEAAGYTLQFGCVSGEDSGAMGLHYVNSTLVNNGVLDPSHPQIIIYEQLPTGRLQLIGADFLVIADQWNATHSAPPQLMGQLFHLFPSPNRFGLPAFYTLHVWAWKDNPNGTFVNWHPNVSCQFFAAQ